MSVFGLVQQRDPDEFLSGPPGLEDITRALKHMANSKAGGTSCDVPELVKHGAPVLQSYLLDLFLTVLVVSVGTPGLANCVAMFYRTACRPSESVNFRSPNAA